jgi:hypothetical protein
MGGIVLTRLTSAEQRDCDSNTEQRVGVGGPDSDGLGRIRTAGLLAQGPT